MSKLNGRVKRLEEQAVEEERVAQQESWIEKIVRWSLESYPTARPGPMGRVNGVDYEWAISWDYVHHFYDELERQELATVPRRFATAEEAQSWIDWTYELLKALTERWGQEDEH